LISRAVDASREIFSRLDEEGNPACSKATWERAVSFLTRFARSASERFGVKIGVPSILPGPQGSVDLNWRSGKSELLVNVPADASKPINFYGDRTDGSWRKGVIVSNVPEDAGLLLWLANQT